MHNQLTDILENAWLRLASVTETGLPSWLWHKVEDDDVLSVGMEETEFVGLAGCPINIESVCRQKEVEVELWGSEWSRVIMQGMLFEGAEDTTKAHVLIISENTLSYNRLHSLLVMHGWLWYLL